MRIALVSPYAWAVPGGVNDHIANLASQLEERGHEPWIVAPSAGVGRGGSGVPRPERFISAGLALPFRTNGSTAYLNIYPHSPWMLRRNLVEPGFDLFHIHEPAVPPTAFLSTFLADGPVVGTFHAAGERSPAYNLFSVILERLMENLTARIAVSPAAEDFVGSRFPGDYRIVPNGVTTDAYADARGMTKVPGRIVFIGRAEPRKGVHVLLRAFREVREARPGASLHLVGTSSEDLQRAAREVWPGMRGPVPGATPLGRVSHEEKVRQLGSAEVAVVPSLEGESFGIVLIECLAAGVPVIASDLPGYRAVLQDGHLGRLVPRDDERALAGAIRAVLDDGGLRGIMSSRGLEGVRRYDWERVADEVIDVYEEALETAPLPVFPKLEVAVTAGARLDKTSRRERAHHT